MNNETFNPASQPSVPENTSSIVDSLAQLSYVIQSVLGRSGAVYDLSPIQLRLLGILRDREPSMKQLAERLELDKSSITGLIDRAERRHLVERIPSPEDRRGFNVRLTPDGRRIAREIGGEIERRIGELAGVLTEAERGQLASLALKVAEARSGPD
ncbi:MarR family transcriptional regulator [Saccharibacillus sp. CPCC 101409]|uniref:MarR family winged helix-turn-helix transcriptional regulator n=1 Tax=Saccharibacillus sp. CPCC 101409 TaxID=3058041 RepID=UPI002672F088|nr:MarR family transcriptional regulator [Saccharibacillus sp. CPCC 101409]MDO3409693.1 MarR family transcriptional regulator [Saccharibacillus sp. CPCC 101409]